METSGAHGAQRSLALHAVPEDFADFIRSDAFPCVGAKSVLALDRLTAFEAGSITSSAHDADIHAALSTFGAQAPEAALRSFACLFDDTREMSEAAFEDALWARLQALHDIDVKRRIGWAENVASEPASTRFCMSIGGRAYFVVGLHPGASRAARRFRRAALVFNPHEQFQQLRADGRYGQIQSINRQRELSRHGSINPMLADFGAGHEAAQYSGREVGADWVCPLEVKA